MSKNPLISIIIPVYKVEQYIEKCLNSLVAQNYPNCEVIMVVDHADDLSEEICKKYEALSFPNVVFRGVYKDKENITAARNIGLGMANGEYLTFVDADDFVEPTFVQSLYNDLINKNADLSICGFIAHKPKRNPFLSKKSTLHLLTANEFMLKVLSYQDFAGMLWNKLFKMSIIKENNITFDPKIIYAEDLLFCYKYHKFCNKIVCNSQPLYHYITRKEGFCRSKFNASRMTILSVLDIIIQDTQDNPELCSTAKGWRGLTCLELLYFAHKAKLQDKNIILILKNGMREATKFVRHNKRLRKLYRFGFGFASWLAKVIW